MNKKQVEKTKAQYINIVLANDEIVSWRYTLEQVLLPDDFGRGVKAGLSIASKFLNRLPRRTI